MKKFRLTLYSGIFFFVSSMPMALANDAPVVDLSQNAPSPTQSVEQPVGATAVLPGAQNSVGAVSMQAAPSHKAKATQPTQMVAQKALSPTLEPTTVGAVQSQTPAANNTVASTPTASLTLAQKMARLQQQMSNLTQMNLPQQVADLQQQMQRLSGQIQEQGHELSMLSAQQKKFYQDLEQQISQLKTMNSTAGQATVKTNNMPATTKAKKPAVKPTASRAMVSLSDADAYQSAFNLLTQKQYAAAKMAFQTYVTQYPTGQYVANAHYWLGEIALIQGQSKAALQQFAQLTQQFAKSPKVPDAKLKIAIIHMKQGKTKLAQKEFQEIKSRYPGTTAAQLASLQLQQIQLGS